MFKAYLYDSNIADVDAMNVDAINVDAMESPSSEHASSTTKKKKKKRKNKKRKKGGGGIATAMSHWIDGNFTFAKLAVGLVSIALLITLSLSLNIREGVIAGIRGKGSSSLRRGARRSDEARENYSGVDAPHREESDNESELGHNHNHDHARMEGFPEHIMQGNTVTPTISNIDSNSENTLESFSLFDSNGSSKRSDPSKSPHPTESPLVGSLNDSDDLKSELPTYESTSSIGTSSTFPPMTSFSPTATSSSADPSNVSDDLENEEPIPMFSQSPHPSEQQEGTLVLPTFSPTTGPLCATGLNQKDYRGLINVTTKGVHCQKWEDFKHFFTDEWDNFFHDAGLEGNNYCRNPFPRRYDRAMCIVAGGFYEYCNVPNCRRPFPSWCKRPDFDVCGCEDKQQSDYRGKINETMDGALCLKWEDELVEYNPNAGLGETYSSGIIITHNYCRNHQPYNKHGAWCETENDISGTEENENRFGFCDVPMCDYRTCGIPQCGNPILSKYGCHSAIHAEDCCQDEDVDCKCTLFKDACRRSLENGSEDFCDDAFAACYGGSYDQNQVCSMFEQICFEFPTQSTCESAAKKCCMLSEYIVPRKYYVTYGANSKCLCHFYTYTWKHLEVGADTMEETCIDADLAENTYFEEELDLLRNMYRATGGDHWFNNSGWEDETIHHCGWHGVVCNSNGYITEISLRKNNLTGNIHSIYPEFSELVKLDLAENKLLGKVYPGFALSLRKLRQIDISNNELSGCADLTFSSKVIRANFSNNKITCVRFKRYNTAYETLQVVDLRQNLIEQDASDVFRDVPSNIEKLILSNNQIRGAFPDPFPTLENMRLFRISNNNLSGSLPDFARSTPLIRELDLSNQRKQEYGGLTGTISPDFSRLGDLSVLNLAFNKLTSLPSDLGTLQKLQKLDLSSNMLSQTIPSELGKLDLLEVLNLSSNKLRGRIPSSFNNFANRRSTSIIYLSGNLDLLNPAPLMLCSMDQFDFATNEGKCPRERNALKEIYQSANGQEWSKNMLWLHPYESHCNWHGVYCDKKAKITGLDLRNNGLSGTLNKEIANLRNLEVLDLSDNNIQGSVPSEIGNLSELLRLRLSYNELTGTMPANLFKNLSRLTLIQLNGNHINGTIPMIYWREEEHYWKGKYDSQSKSIQDSIPTIVWREEHGIVTDTADYLSSFVADCGSPSDFNMSLTCENCTMCCNNRGDCYPQEETAVQKLGAEDYSNSTWIVLVSIIALSYIVALVSKQLCYIDGSVTEDSYNKATRAIGDDSVYQFILGESKVGWTIVLITVVVQIVLPVMFLQAAEVELSEDNVDLVYTWQCPRVTSQCSNTTDVTSFGWVVFSILIALKLSKDIMNGFRLTWLSGQHKKIRFFLGALILNFVSLFTLYVSIIYNKAIATSNTELVINSIGILFVTEADEDLYAILERINSEWAGGMGKMSLKNHDVERDEDEQDNNNNENKVKSGDNDEGNDESQSEASSLKIEMNELRQTIDNLRKKVELNNYTYSVAPVWEMGQQHNTPLAL